MTTIKQFHDRLDKIGVNVEFVSNVPWIYLHKVNGKLVRGKFYGNHGFTAFFMSVRAGRAQRITDISMIFDKIRETLKQ